MVPGDGSLDSLESFGDVGELQCGAAVGSAFQDGADVGRVADVPGLGLALELIDDVGGQAQRMTYKPGKRKG